MSHDDITVRLHVRAGFALSLGVYDGPITHKTISAHVRRMLTDTDIAEFIDSWTIESVSTDDDATLLIAAQE